MSYYGMRLYKILEQLNYIALCLYVSQIRFEIFPSSAIKLQVASNKIQEI